MASKHEHEDDDVSDEEDTTQAKSSKATSGAAAQLKNVDRSDDKEMSTSSVDLKQLIDTKASADQLAAQQTAKELAAIKVAAADIDLIVSETELSRDEAERILKEHRNDLVAALRACTN